MKKIITVLFLSITTLIFAQENEVKEIKVNDELNQKIDSFFKDYFKLVEAQNWNEAIDQMPKGFVDLIGKDAFVAQMKAAFDNEAFTTTFNEMSFKNISNAYTYENVTYANVNYFNSFTFHFKQSDTQNDDDFDTYMEFMTGTFANKHKDEKVERKGKDITISGDKVILLIDDSNANGLKMLELQNGLAEMYKMFIPEVVVNKFFEL